MAENVRAMEAFALRLVRAGHVPVVGEWLALPLAALAGSERVGDEPFNEIFHPIAEGCWSTAMQVLRLEGRLRGGFDGVGRSGERLSDLSRLG